MICRDNVVRFGDTILVAYTLEEVENRLGRDYDNEMLVHDATAVNTIMRPVRVLVSAAGRPDLTWEGLPSRAPNWQSMLTFTSVSRLRALHA